MKISLIVGRDKAKPFPAYCLCTSAGNAEPVLSEVEGLIPAYNIILLIKKWNRNR
jgi:hypothetical protein